jgi:hypothetical protein
MFAAMIGCCALAMFCFPKYPSTPVPEWLANAFTLPAIIAVLICWWLPRPPAEQMKFFKKWTYILLIAYITGIGFTRWATIWPYRRALPWSASDIQERFSTDGLLPDFSYSLKAKISHAEFLEYVAKFQLRKTGSQALSGTSNGATTSNPFDGPETYSRESGDFSMRAAYSNGYIYVEAGET